MILFVIKCISVPRDSSYRQGLVIRDLCVTTIIFVEEITVNIIIPAV